MYENAGIYKITHKASGKCYVGSSIDVYKRMASHKSNLTRGKHHNTALLQDYSEYGERAFTFEVLTKCAVEELIPTEDQWIESLQAVETGYNLMSKSGNTGPRPRSQGRKKTAAQKKRDEMEIREQFCQTMREFVKYKDWDNPEGVTLAFQTFHLQSGTGKTPPSRIKKFADVVLSVMEECMTLKPGLYKLNSFYYAGSSCSYLLEQVEKTIYRQSEDVYSMLSEAVVEELMCNPITRKYMTDLKKRGIDILKEEE